MENWEILGRFLPTEWAEPARRLGARRRARYIPAPGTLLRVWLLHLATGCFWAETAARASAGGWAQSSAVGVFQRLRAAEPWLRWLAQRSPPTVSAESLEFAEYFLVWTTLPESVQTAPILELYRLRGQMELVFKRRKSILGRGPLPKNDPRSAPAGLEGKLFAGWRIERMIRTAESVSPWGYSVATPTQPMARGGIAVSSGGRCPWAATDSGNGTAPVAHEQPCLSRAAQNAAPLQVFLG